MPSQLLSLDVEGVIFKTRISTLTSIDGTFFSKLFEIPNWKEQLDKDSRLFIDRDSSIFPFILNYLRDHEKFPLPRDEYQLQRIHREAIYFNINPLKNTIEQIIKGSSNICTCIHPPAPPIPTTPIPQKDSTIRRIPPTKPPPPPPPPLQTRRENNSPEVLIPLRKSTMERNSKKIKKTASDSISLPRNFTHIAHVGWNGKSMLLDKTAGSDDTVRKICDAAAEAVDMNAVYNVVNKNGTGDSESVEVLITGGVMQSREGTSRH